MKRALPLLFVPLVLAAGGDFLGGGVPAWTAGGAESGDAFGSSVAGAGDVNGDTFDDVLVGAENATWQTGWGDSGAAFLYLGSAQGLSSTPAWSAGVLENNASFGGSVAGAGDVNGDGYDDVVVGAWRHDAPGLVDAGGAWLYLGSAAGLATEPAWSVQGTEQGAALGRAVAGIGDLDGDGWPDVAVGAPGVECGAGPLCGQVLVARGSATGLLPGFAWALSGTVAGAELGASLAGGQGSLLAVEPGFSTSGRVQLVSGFSPAIWTTAGSASSFVGPDPLIAGGALYEGSTGVVVWTSPDSSVGEVVAGVGDVNGDGLQDLALASPLGFGSVQLFAGGALAPQSFPAWLGGGVDPGGGFGGVLAAAGDVNGDGYDDLLVAAPSEDTGVVDAGRVYLYAGDNPDTDGDGVPDPLDCAPEDPTTADCGDDDDSGDDDDAGDDDSGDDDDDDSGDDDSGDDDSGDDDVGDDDAGDDDVGDDDSAELPGGGCGCGAPARGEPIGLALLMLLTLSILPSSRRHRAL